MSKNRWNIWNKRLQHTCIAIAINATSWSTFATFIYELQYTSKISKTLETYVCNMRWLGRRQRPSIHPGADLPFLPTSEVDGAQTSLSDGASLTYLPFGDGCGCGVAALEKVTACGVRCLRRAPPRWRRWATLSFLGEEIDWSSDTECRRTK
jgi:hypothetical protein